MNSTVANTYRADTYRRKHHYRIVDPVRFFIFILICVMIIIFAGYSILNIGSAEASAAKSYAEVQIADNDTMWAIAEMYNQDVDMDTREIIHEICVLNGIDAGDIHPGDVITVPVY